jgi:hypothetical protein
LIHGWKLEARFEIVRLLITSLGRPSTALRFLGWLKFRKQFKIGKVEYLRSGSTYCRNASGGLNTLWAIIVSLDLRKCNLLAGDGTSLVVVEC